MPQSSRPLKGIGRQVTCMLVLVEPVDAPESADTGSMVPRQATAKATADLATCAAVPASGA